jgi:hypothetical protein
MFTVQNFFVLQLFFFQIINVNGNDFSFPGEKPKVLDIHALVGGDIQINPGKTNQTRHPTHPRRNY